MTRSYDLGNVRGFIGPQGIPGERGEQGEQGRGLQIKGYFDSEIDLRAANPDHSYMYGVGISAPYDIWGYDDIKNDWTNIGKLQGAEGKSAYNVALDNGFIGTQSEWLASLKGERGLQGAPGVTGAKGDTGSQGISGAPGPQGAKGDKGDTGTQGIQGIPGIPGEKGNTGATGAQGIQGAQGIPGPQGNKGDPTTVNGKTGTSITLTASDIMATSGKSVQAELDGKSPAFTIQEKDVIMFEDVVADPIAKCRKSQDGMVFLYGGIKRELPLSNSRLIFTLPEGFCPKYRHDLPVAITRGDGGFGQFIIDIDCSVYFYAVGVTNVTEVSFSLAFPAIL